MSSVPNDANMPISYFSVIVKFAEAPLKTTLSTVDVISTALITAESNSSTTAPDLADKNQLLNQEGNEQSTIFSDL